MTTLEFVNIFNDVYASLHLDRHPDIHFYASFRNREAKSSRKFWVHSIAKDRNALYRSSSDLILRPELTRWKWSTDISSEICHSLVSDWNFCLLLVSFIFWKYAGNNV